MTATNGAERSRTPRSDVLGGAPPRIGTERAIKWAGFAAALAAAVATLLTDGELELTLLMAVTVVAALAAFDAALDRQVRSALPWLLVSAAVLARSVPHVVAGLQDQPAITVERLQHGAVVAATLLFALALSALAVPSRKRMHRNLTIVVLGLATLTGGVSGATAAFAGPGAFAGSTEARWFEALGWAGVGLMLAAAVFAAAATPRVTRSRALLIVAGLAFAVLAAWETAGEPIDIGWWALAFTAAAGASLLHSPPLLITLAGQNRRSFTGLVVAVLIAIVAARSLVVGLGDDDASRVGLAALGVLAVAALGTGVAFERFGLVRKSPTSTRPRSARSRDRQAPAEPAAPPAVVEPRAPVALLHDVLDDDDDNPTPRIGLDEPIVEPLTSDENGDALVPAAMDVPAARVDAGPSELERLIGPDPDVEPGSLNDLSSGDEDGAGEGSGDESGDPVPRPEAIAEPVDEIAGIDPVWADDRVFWPPEIANDVSLDPSEPDPVDPTIAEYSPLPDESDPGDRDSAGSDDSARNLSVEVPVTPAEPLLDVAALEPRHVDPATGLLSGSGLQRAIEAAFDPSVAAGEVTIVMISMRNTADIEKSLGRVLTAQVIAAIGNRLSEAMPYASTARYARNDFAAIVRGVPEDTQVVIDRCTNVLLDLLEPVVLGDQEVDVDVAAGLAQSYAGEAAEQFIDRANRGLARALDSAEPTLVAMP